MSDIKFIKKTLNDIFIVGRGLPKYTQSYANRNKGEYPVYSSKTENDGLFATINTNDMRLHPHNIPRYERYSRCKTP